jgi:hypothetical protein
MTDDSKGILSFQTPHMFINVFIKAYHYWLLSLPNAIRITSELIADFLFIYCLFNDADSISVCTVSNVGMISRKLKGKECRK